MANTDAGAELVALFKRYGLESLAGRILDFAKQGLSNDETYLKLQDSQEWKTRFAGNEIRRQKGLAVLSPDEYLSRESAYAEDMRSYGLPPGFYDHPDDYAKLIGANVGSGELRKRLDAHKAVVEDGANTGVLQYARDKYGLSTGDLIAYFVDPDRAAPLLEKIAAASQIGAGAVRTKWGDLSAAEAERLAALGVTGAQAQSGFGQAAGLLELTANVGGQGIAREDLTNAIFADDAAAKARVTRKQDERKAQFAGGGGFAESKTGLAGLGSANT